MSDLHDSLDLSTWVKIFEVHYFDIDKIRLFVHIQHQKGLKHQALPAIFRMVATEQEY